MNTTVEVMKQNWIVSLASGNARLTKAFYEAHLFWSVLIFLIYWFLVPLVVSKLPISMSQAANYIFIPAIVLINIYVLFSLVAIWRCAFNVNKLVWGYVARIYAIIIILLSIYKIIKNIAA